MLTNQETLSKLLDIQTRSSPLITALPKAGNYYDIDLNTRSISAPKVLSVSKDHKSAVVYFRVDRYYDIMDLSNTICLIQYIPPGDKSGIAHTYIVPYYDIISQSDKGKIVFPWVVNGAAAKTEGDLKFAIRFYKVNIADDNKITLTYNLNTEPASSRILHGLQVDDEKMKKEYDIPIEDEGYLGLIQQLSNQRTVWRFI